MNTQLIIIVIGENKNMVKFIPRYTLSNIRFLCPLDCMFFFFLKSNNGRNKGTAARYSCIHC